MYTYPYFVLEKHLKEKVTELREVDWYLQQDSTSDKNTWLFTAPCVFIEFQPLDVLNDLGHRIQSARTEISIHLLTENVRDKGSKIISKTTPGINHAVLFDKIFKCLHGFSAKLSYLDTFTDLAGTNQDQRVLNSLSRTGITNPHITRKTMIKSIQRFRCMVYDHAAVNLYKVPDPKPTLDVHVHLDIDNNTGIEYFDDFFADEFA